MSVHDFPVRRVRIGFDDWFYVVRARAPHCFCGGCKVCRENYEFDEIPQTIYCNTCHTYPDEWEHTVYLSYDKILCYNYDESNYYGRSDRGWCGLCDMRRPFFHPDSKKDHCRCDFFECEECKNVMESSRSYLENARKIGRIIYTPMEKPKPSLPVSYR
jgi:hypothetical protein